MAREKLTTAWQRYEEGKQYNLRLTPDQYSLVDANTEFFAGNQWAHLPQSSAMSRLPKPVFNIIKRVTNVQVASLMSSGISVNLEPLAYYDGTSVEDPDSTACEFAQAEVENLLEKFRIKYRAREALFDGAISGDYCAHFYFDPTAQPYGGRLNDANMGEIRMELVDGINVMFGNPNVCDVQSQPYILLVGRDTVDNLNDELKAHGGDGMLTVQQDNESMYQTGIGGRTEINTTEGHAKATYILMYEKKTKRVPMRDENGDVMMEPVYDKAGEPVYETEDGKPVLDLNGQPVQKLRKRYEERTTVHVSKSTRGVEIYSDIDTGLDRYPVAWGVWEKQKNQYHGRALVTGIIPNQIFINSSFAMVMRHEQLQAFPKRVYNADLISDWSNEIGVDIGVRGLQPNQPINQVATTLGSPDISNQIIYVIEKAISYTKECLGTTDAQLGSAKIDNTSALMVLNTNSQTPLENIRANLNEWVEDIVAILLDMMGTYYGERPIVRDRTFSEPVTDEVTGLPTLGTYDGLMQTKQVTRKVIESYGFQKFKRLYFNCRVDVGAGNAFSEIAMLQTLDKMRSEGVIELIDYLERVPDTVVPGRQRLIQKLKTQQAAASGGTPAGMMPSQAAAPQNEGVHRVLQQMNPDKLAKSRRPNEAAPTADDAINALPINVREQFEQLPPRAKGEVAKAAAERMKQ